MCREGDKKKFFWDSWKKTTACSAESRAPKYKIKYKKDWWVQNCAYTKKMEILPNMKLKCIHSKRWF